MIPLGIFAGNSGLVTSALGIITLATFAGLGLGLGRIKDLRSQLSEDREQVRALREDRADLKERLAEQLVLITKQAGDIEVLQGVVTREVEWKVLTDQVSDQTEHLDAQTRTLNEHHKEARAYWEKSHDRWDSAEVKVDAVMEYLKGSGEK